MRNAFCNVLFEMAHRDERVWLLTGDLGYSVLEPFAKEFPSRFVNMGVAEQNMMGVATGLALSGKIVFVYSIANFPIMRCLEQIRNDVCYHKANVKIVAVGGGLCYGTAGFSHYATEDLAIMRAMPGMVVTAPSDELEAAQITRIAITAPGPFYIRLGRNNEPIVHANPSELHLGEPVCLNQNSGEIALVSTGTLVSEVLQAAEMLKSFGIEARVLSMPFVKPIDHKRFLQFLDGCRLVLVIEEHTAFGGLGSAIAEILAEAALSIKFARIHLPEFINFIGSQKELRQILGLDASSIAKRAIAFLKNEGDAPCFPSVSAFTKEDGTIV
ncbi:MAG: transketolase [Proteobacteria bacterium]|nr:transketolase [Pseudomonadota bacterium]